MNMATGNSVCVSTASRSWLVCILYRWMYRCPSIREGLAALGHDKHRKFFLKPEVEVIVRGLGEP